MPGQSYGGLAAAWVAAAHPELVGAAIVQSGSFWHGVPSGERAGVGRLLAELRAGGGDVTTPVAVQVGTEEDELLPLNRAYRDALLARGAPWVSHREVRGGHDYAWWRHGLVAALREVDQRLASPIPASPRPPAAPARRRS